MAHGGQEFSGGDEKQHDFSGGDEKQHDEEPDLQKLIDYINSKTDYRVVTKSEHDIMKAAKKKVKSETCQKLNLSDDNDNDDDDDGSTPQHKPPTPKPGGVYKFPHQQQFQYGQRPNLPQFSGENRSGDVTFDVWKYDVRCLIHEGAYPLALIRQCIRNSLRGKARSILVTMGEDVTPESTVQKLESIFGNVCDKEALLETFYQQSQNSGESVAEFGMRLQNLLQIPMERGMISISEKNSMLCSKFFSGLKNPLLQTAIRFKYQHTIDFDGLLREARTVELQLQSTSTGSESKPDTAATAKQQSASRTSLDDIAKKLEVLTTQVHDLQSQMKTVKGNRDGQSTQSFQQPDDRGYDDYSGYHRGYRPGYRGTGNRGRGFDRGGRYDRGYGGRGGSDTRPLNLRKSPSRGTRW